MFLCFITHARLLAVRLALHGGGVDVVCDGLADGCVDDVGKGFVVTR